MEEMNCWSTPQHDPALNLQVNIRLWTLLTFLAQKKRALFSLYVMHYFCLEKGILKSNKPKIQRHRDAKAKAAWQKIPSTWSNTHAIIKDHKETNMLMISTHRKKFTYPFNNYFCFQYALAMTLMVSPWSLWREVLLWTQNIMMYQQTPQRTHNCQALVVPQSPAECKCLRAVGKYSTSLFFFLQLIHHISKFHLPVRFLNPSSLSPKFPSFL